MTIYIYGSDSFKNEIDEVLNRSSVKLRLDRSEVIKLETLSELKNSIEENPNNIYLIDDSKIIKKNIITEKIKFLNPKDGIEQEYLLDHGIGDVSVDSIDELAKHIIKKLDEEEDELDNIENIQNSIIEIVEDAYEEDDSNEKNAKQDESIDEEKNENNVKQDEPIEEEINNEESIDEEESSDDESFVKIDDELNALLSSSKEDDDFFEEEDETNDEEELLNILSIADELEVPEEEVPAKEAPEEEAPEEEKEYKVSSTNLDDLLLELEDNHNEIISTKNNDEKDNDLESLEDVMDQIEEKEIPIESTEKLSFDNNLDSIINNEKSVESSIKMQDNNHTQGERMSEQFSEFDTLSEDDILAALNGINNVTVKNENGVKLNENDTEKAESSTSNSIDLKNSDSSEIAKLITQLLNNKTLEITIKVKE